MPHNVTIAIHTARQAHRALIATAAHVEADGLVIDPNVIEAVGDIAEDLIDIAAGNLAPGALDGLPSIFARAAASYRARRGIPR